MTKKKIIAWFVLLVLPGMLIFSLNVFAQDLPGRQPQASQFPTGQVEEESVPIGAEVFGREGGYLHPFLFAEGKYTDNLYYTNTNEQEDFITSIAPGIWLAVPANREKLLQLHTSPTSPGGLQVSRMKPQSNRRMQTYFMYTPSFVFYSDNPDQNHVDHKAEGLFQYNFDMGLSLDVMDQFNRRYETNNNAEERFDKYYDNIASLLLSYKPSEKFRFRVDLTNYWLDYDDSRNDFRDRMDNSAAVYVFYQFRPKTSVFAQYEYADIEYDENDMFNSQEHRYYLGAEWDITADSRGRIKGGYIKKEFDDSALGEEDGFSAELQMLHSFNPKRHATLTAYRRYTESSIDTAFAVLTTGVDFALMQRFTPKWSATLNALYYKDDFQGEFSVGGVTREREDETFRIGPALIFEPKDWMKVNLAYYFSRRDSNFDVFDFENNTVSLSIELAL
jgi:hypothetical protein